MKFDPVGSLKQFWDDAQRMLSVSYKPSAVEFKRTLKIVLFGTIVLGIIGYLISIVVGLIV